MASYTNSAMQRVTFYMPPEQLEQLNELAVARETNLSNILRDAIKTYLQNQLESLL